MRTLRFATVLAVLLLIITTSLSALAVPSGMVLEIYVNAKDNLGLNLREGPGTEYPTVLPAPIPMYTKLRITQETLDGKGLPWGYTTYTDSTGTYEGWVCLVEVSQTDPRPSPSPTPAPTPSPTPVPTPTPAAASAPIPSPEQSTPAVSLPLASTAPAAASPARADQGGGLSTLVTILYAFGGVAVAGSVIALVFLFLRSRSR